MIVMKVFKRLFGVRQTLYREAQLALRAVVGARPQCIPGRPGREFVANVLITRECEFMHVAGDVPVFSMPATHEFVTHPRNQPNK